MDQSAVVTEVIRVSGIVQGVGFRPFAARLARERHIRGSVRNAQGHVVIEACGSPENIELYVQALQAQKPDGCIITDIQRQSAATADTPESFRIIASNASGSGQIMPSPDLALCGDCLAELFSPGDPRFGNPFISCTRCGPRFSVMRCAPYDRRNTSMDSFPLCPLCAAQYGDPTDRRCHAQTICCNACGPKLYYRDRQDEAEGLQGAAEALMQGQIVAVKGIGGYHLACSPFDANAVQALRGLKGRERKPFAVMFADLAALREHCEISPEEETLLTDTARPIVLLSRKFSHIAEEVYTTSPCLGAFLPYTPLQHLLLRQTGPLVMTSTNASSQPIICGDKEMLHFFEANDALDGVLWHDRPILRRLDDSVAAVTLGEPSLLRRARGYVPRPILLGGTGPSLLACGAQEKSTFCLCQDGCAWMSTELGDLDSLEAEHVYRDAIADMQSILRVKPQLVVCDLHPGYVATQYAEQLGIPLLRVQHHHAHIASVMAEHGLAEPILGVAFDGTGYGADGTIWGGEFLLVSPEGCRRLGHIKATAFLGGDESIRQGWKSAACLLYDAGLPPQDERSTLVHAALAHGINTIRSSSMGRVFDAVSSLLGICHESAYGGQCAIELENAAAKHLLNGNPQAEPFNYDIYEEDGQFIVDLAPCIREIYSLDEAPNALAWRFQVTVSHVIMDLCGRLAEQTGIRKVALSGGVFANRLLLEQVVPLLRQAGFAVYRNRQAPPGDGGIALGQAQIGLWEEKHHVHRGSGQTD